MEIYRDIIGAFNDWRRTSGRKPLLLGGARQVGKTWVMESFGRDYFDNYVKIDFNSQPEAAQIFSVTKDPRRIIKELALYSGKPVLPEKTLIIFDEIQECENALNVLKYFCEEAPEYCVMGAGSLLGVAVRHKSMSVPVGKVRMMRLYPLTFREFLRSADEGAYAYVEAADPLEPLPDYILNRLESEYRRFQICGGMPDAAKTMLEGKGMDEVEQTLQDILDLYELDFAKYAEPREIPRISAVWHSLPSQLAKENRKFIYNVIRSGARSKDYEDALLWLKNAGMIYTLHETSKPGVPLSAYLSPGIFKAYACDCGLLRRLARLSPRVMLDPIGGYTEFKGALAENMAIQNIMPDERRQSLGYWTSEGKAEVDLLIEKDNDIFPVEIKSGDNVSGKSLYQYNLKFAPRLLIRLSRQNVKFTGRLLNYPLALAPWLPHRLPEIMASAGSAAS